MLRLAVFAVLSLAMISSPTWAQGKKSSKKSERGTLAKVVKVEGNDLTVSVKDRKAKKEVEKTITVDSDVKLVCIIPDFKLSDLKPGDQVLLIEKKKKVTEIRVVKQPK